MSDVQEKKTATLTVGEWWTVAAALAGDAARLIEKEHYASAASIYEASAKIMEAIGEPERAAADRQRVENLTAKWQQQERQEQQAEAPLLSDADSAEIQADRERRRRRDEDWMPGPPEHGPY